MPRPFAMMAARQLMKQGVGRGLMGGGARSLMGGGRPGLRGLLAGRGLMAGRPGLRAKGLTARRGLRGLW